MAFDQTKAFETRQGFRVESAAGFFSGADSPVGSDAPIGSLYKQTDGTIWVKSSSGVNGWHIGLRKLGWSQKVTEASGQVSLVEFFQNATQTTPNLRAQSAISYDGSGTPTTEVWTFYDTDGTTVLRTVTLTHSFTGLALTGTTETVA